MSKTRIDPKDIPPPPSKLRIPTREEIVALAMDIYRLALDAKLTYVNKHGVEHTHAKPDFRAACEALRVVNNVCGYEGTNRQRNAASEAEVQPLDADAALERMRSKIAKADS